ncbi:MAG: signal peptidase II [Caldilineaceae bacterium]
MKAISRWFNHAWITLLVAGVIVFFDQWTKIWVRANLEKYVFYPVFGEWFGWQHVDNYGAAFGIFQNMRLPLTIFAVAVSIAILVYVLWVPTSHRLLRVLLGMQLAGATGNLIDRAMQGFVTDFVRMGIPGVFYWPNYNIADVAIVTGVISLAIYVIAEDVSTARKQKAAAAGGEIAGSK